ncbi:CheW domain-containing protein [Pseudomonas sp. TTU2014-080ASC]|uniref:CheW domain-containing protein n=1 Tax=Pseudomonas sp. TTU2014-080ASC TaxID=1729724 RepID=UPI0007187EE5|nr:CheW domain-containing protein [Pseudomonas sp. TTU2014-080ASC]KRW59485.1 chemotaxis protein CheW [Pseudomonas sp. TTU2014-080ASC]
MSRPLATANRTQLALQSYLDDLLQEAAVELSVSESTSISPDEFELAVLEEQVRDARLNRPEPVAVVAPLVTPSEPVQKVVQLQPAVPVQIDEPTPWGQPANEPQPPAQVFRERPEWADGPFECLLFDVAGLTLAVPLVSLGSIYPLEGQELTPLFGQPNWFLGILPSQSGNLKVVDTARWVMPDRYRDEFRDNLQYVISVGGYEWGLAVHQVSRSIRIDPAEVKWRSQRTQRPWLAGTVIEHMCALLDVAALAELIASGATRSMQPGQVH